MSSKDKTVISGFSLLPFSVPNADVCGIRDKVSITSVVGYYSGFNMDLRREENVHHYFIRLA